MSPVTSGFLDEKNSVQVTSGDEKTTNLYQFNFYEPVLVPGMEAMPIRVYPNPAKDQINIKGIASQSTILVLNMYGGTISMTNNEYSEQIQISIPELSPGIYFVQVKNKNYRTFTIKLVKE
jgi:hypothetical protein